MNPVWLNWIRTLWFLLMCVFVCLCLLLCAVAAWSCGAAIEEVRENTQESFLRFVEGWH